MLPLPLLLNGRRQYYIIIIIVRRYTRALYHSNENTIRGKGETYRYIVMSRRGEEGCTATPQTIWGGLSPYYILRRRALGYDPRHSTVSSLSARVYIWPTPPPRQNEEIHAWLPIVRHCFLVGAVRISWWWWRRRRVRVWRRQGRWAVTNTRSGFFSLLLLSSSYTPLISRRAV